MSRKKQLYEEVSEHTAVHPLLTQFKAEMDALGAQVQPVRLSTANLIAEGNEMARARAHVDDLVSRGYLVTNATFDRLQALMETLQWAELRKLDLIRERKAKTAAAEESRARALEVRAHILRIAEVEDFKEFPDVAATRIDDFVHQMSLFLLRARQWEPRFDKERVEMLVREGESLQKVCMAMIDAGQDLETTRIKATDDAERIRRLAFNLLREVSKVGLAVYAGDIEREEPYRLDRLIHRRAKRDDAPETAPPAADDSDQGVTD